VLVIVLGGVIRVVRYTKHNRPPATALLPGPTEVLEGGKGAGEQGGKEGR
jgi:hypothetical protein